VSIQHVVLFRFEPALDAEAGAELMAQVRSWPDQIGGFEVLRLGPPATTARTRDYHYLLHMVLPDAAALEAYQGHPAHRRFVQWVGEHGGSVLAFDYPLDASTVIPTSPAAARDA
jgi:Stress responsive A/B Barrel Domain